MLSPFRREALSPCGTTPACTTNVTCEACIWGRVLAAARSGRGGGSCKGGLGSTERPAARSCILHQPAHVQVCRLRARTDDAVSSSLPARACTGIQVHVISRNPRVLSHVQTSTVHRGTARKSSRPAEVNIVSVVWKLQARACVPERRSPRRSP